MGVSVVVCTHSAERRLMLDDLIRSIVSGSLQPHEVVIVVDRNPPLLEQLRAQRWPLPVRVLASSGSGLSAARNTGWQAVQSAAVAFIDDDAVASGDWLAELVAAFEQYQADVVGGHLEPSWTGGQPAWFSRSLGWVVGCSYDGMPRVPARVRNVIGCNMLIRRSLLEQLGGFNTTFGRTGGGLAGAEETELCIRANQLGATVMLIPGASVEQILPAARGRFAYFLRRGWDEGHSKQQLRALHGRMVLGTETRYARGLLREVATRLLSGVRRRQIPELQRAFAILAVLLTTTISYVGHSLTSAAIIATVTMRGSRTLVPRPVDHDV
jgi:glycosyltransferase involved in cell wall biosynthesis